MSDTLESERASHVVMDMSERGILRQANELVVSSYANAYGQLVLVEVVEATDNSNIASLSMYHY